SVVRLPRAEHRFLHGVLGLEGRGEHAVAVARQVGAVLVEEATEVAFGFQARLLHGPKGTDEFGCPLPSMGSRPPKTSERSPKGTTDGDHRLRVRPGGARRSFGHLRRRQPAAGIRAAARHRSLVALGTYLPR